MKCKICKEFGEETITGLCKKCIELNFDHGISVDHIVQTDKWIGITYADGLNVNYTEQYIDYVDAFIAAVKLNNKRYNENIDLSVFSFNAEKFNACLNDIQRGMEGPEQDYDKMRSAIEKARQLLLK